MIIYIIKSVICSGIFLLCYKILLEKEKLHVFNRAYLIAAVILSLIAPFLSIEIKTTNNNFLQPVSSAGQALNNIDYFNSDQQLDGLGPKEPIVDRPTGQTNSYLSPGLIISFLYAVIVCIFLFRMIKNIYALFRKTRKSDSVDSDNVHFILLDKQVMPFTFLNYVFVNKEAYNNGTINSAILKHEMAHASQKHSLDIIFIELIKSFFFFNPCIYGFKKAIQMNHEFLADDEAKTVSGTEREYQLLLISASTTTSKQKPFTNSFHYLTTKKRIKMITHETPVVQKFFRTILTLVFVITTILFLGFKYVDNIEQQPFNTVVPADDTLRKPLPYDTIPHNFTFLSKSSIGYTEQGISQAELDEFHDILSPSFLKKGNTIIFNSSKMSKEDTKKLEDIFKKMSLRQQSTLPVLFVKPSKPQPKTTLPEKQFQNFKNPAVYGLWIDDKKVPNTALEKYSADDFSSYFISKLYGAAKKGRSYTHQVNLETNAHFAKRFKEAMDKYNDAVRSNEGSLILATYDKQQYGIMLK